MMLDVDCQPYDYPCWQHYGEHYASQPPTRWVIDLALAVVRFRAATAKTDDDFFLLYMASHRLHELISQRWRNCVFEPFEFPVGSSQDTFVPVDDKIKTHELLEQLGFNLKPPTTQPIHRRF